MADLVAKQLTIQNIKQLQLPIQLISDLDHMDKAVIIVNAISELQRYTEQWH